MEMNGKKTEQIIIPSIKATKAELLQVGIFFGLNFLPWEFVLVQKLEIEKTKTT